MTDRGTLLKVDDATGTTTTIATGTSTGGSCRRFGETAPSVQCGLLTMDSISADVLWTQPRGDPTIGWLPREGGASTRSLEPPDQRVLAFLPGSRLVASSTRASERISVANGLGNPDWTSAPLIAFSEPLSQAGNSIGIDRNGTLLEVRDDGTLCASLSQDQRARRLFTVGYTVLGVGPLFVDGGASVENQQHLSFIRVR